jgi:hypothetical protein
MSKHKEYLEKVREAEKQLEYKHEEFLERVRRAEERLGYKLPLDYIQFIEKYEGLGDGWFEWFGIDDLQLASGYDIPNFVLIEETPDLLNEEDCEHIVPVFRDNDSYIVIDLRENGKGVFIIWSDETELGYQSKTFSELVEKLRKDFEDDDEFTYFID